MDNNFSKNDNEKLFTNKNIEKKKKFLSDEKKVKFW